MPNTPRPAPPGPAMAARPAPVEGRRDFLRLLALAPAAAAGCAAARGAAPAPTAALAPAAPPPAGQGPADPLALLREAPLPADAEPALVFRAAPARPGE